MPVSAHVACRVIGFTPDSFPSVRFMPIPGAKRVSIVQGASRGSFEDDLRLTSVVHIIDVETMLPATEPILADRPWRFCPKVSSARLREALHSIFGNPALPTSTGIFQSSHCVVIFDGRSKQASKEVSTLVNKCLKLVNKDRGCCYYTLQACPQMSQARPNHCSIRHACRMISMPGR